MSGGLLLSAALLSCSVGNGNYEKLKPMEWVIGTWSREWVADKTTDIAKKGDKLSKEWQFKWTPNNQAILITQLSRVNGKVAGQLDSLFGWNKQAEAIKGSGFGSNGVAGSGWTLEANKEKFTISAGSSEWKFVPKGKDGLEITTPKGVKRVYRRVKEKK